MKILVIEDMDLIREGIKKMILNYSYPWEKVLEARNGREGLRYIEEEHPDMVITDIRMPEMDGFELIKEAKARWANIIFIIVTGHAEFNYAKQAVDMDATGFILKPIDQEQFYSILRKGIDKWEKSYQVESMEQEKRLLEKKSRDHLIHRQVNRTFLDVNGQVLILHEGHAYKVLYIHFSKETSSDMGILEQLIQQESFPMGYHLIENVTNSQEWFIVLFDKNVKRLQVESKHLERRLQAGLATMDTGVFVYGSSIEMQLCKAMYDEMKKAYMHTLFQQEEVYTTSDEKEPLDIKDNLRFIHDNLDKKDYEKAKAIIHKLFTYHTLKKNTRTRILVLYSLISSVLFEAFNIPMVDIEQNKLFKGSDVLEHCETIEEVRDQLIALLDELIKENMGMTFDKNSISHVKAYIDEHYTEDITVNGLAAKLNISSSYLSNAFKKKYKISPFSYITTKRIEKACGLLTESSYHINSISEAVGYNDVQHFYRVFKKHTGMTPLKYRGKHMES